MKKGCEKIMHRLLCYGLVMAMVFTPAFSVFASEEDPSEQSAEGTAVTESITQETPQAYPEASSDSEETNAADTASTDSPEVSTEETQEPAPAQTSEAGETGEAAEAADDAEAIETPEQQVNVDPVQAESVPSVSVPALDTGLKSTAESSSAKSIRIGDTSFSSDGNESSHWSDGKGWKNVSGQYVAMVDYDGRKAEISAEEGIVTLAVSGVNRIGALKGNCSYRIAGTGIVLIDRIEIGSGNTITLHPNTALYSEGSAAVFVKQDDDSYKLINGDVTGILDDKYSLDNVKLVLPNGTSLTVGVLAARKETWSGEDTDGPVTDVTLYTTDLPVDCENPVHDLGTVEIEEYVGSVILGENSTLTIDEGASVQLKKIRTGFSYIEAELVVKGALNVLGVLEGGFIDINNGGSVTGNGTVRSANVNLNPGGKISEDLLLEKSGLSVHGNDRSITPPKLQDSAIYL